MTTWSGDYAKAIVQMMTQASTEYDVLFVDYQFTWKDVVMKLLGKGAAPVRRMLGINPRIRREEAAYVLTPLPLLPINWIGNHKIHRVLNDFNGWILTQQVKDAQRRLGLENATFIYAFNPIAGYPIHQNLKPRNSYYYCYDNIASANWCSAHGAYYENLLMTRVSGIITSSEGLFQQKSPWNERSILIRNGADTALFSQAFKRNPPTQKVVCYMGSLDDRLDYKLLQGAIKMMPETHFRFIGRVCHPLAEQLADYPNVTLHGPKSLEQLQHWLQDACVGIIPFAKNAFTQNIYPLKINEYLAAGLPVVLTDFAPLNEFSSITYKASGVADFVAALEHAIDDDRATLRTRRQQFAKAQDWSSRFDELKAFISPEKAKRHVEAV